MKRIMIIAAATLLVPALWAELPSDYTALDGIKSTSGGKQYILTDYVPSSCSNKIEAVVTMSGYSTQCIWCSRMGMTQDTMTLFAWASPNYFRFDRATNTGTYADKGIGTDAKGTLTADYKTRKFSIDGVEVSGKTMGAGDFTPQAPLAFFSSHMNGSGWGNYAVITLHGVKVWNAEGELECDFVPVRCEANAGKANEYGLYDTVRGKYHSTSGAVAFVPVEQTKVEWSEDAENDAWVLKVNGQYTMTEADAAKLVANTHANFIKRGSGIVFGTPITNYVGNITIEQGVYRLAHQYDCGADNVGWIRVMDGATLEVRGFDVTKETRAITGKTVYTAGKGYNGMGAISGGCSWNSCSKCRFILEGDSYWYADSEFNFIDYIDLAGHKLTGRQANTWTRWGISGNTITNSAATAATFEFVGGIMRPGALSQFRGKATDGVVKIYSETSATTVVVPTYGLSSVWPIEIGPNVSYSARGITDHSNTENGTLNGPITMKGKVKLATDIDKGKNSLVNLKGTLTGSGTTEIGTGWVNYHTKSNDYAGEVTVARSNDMVEASCRAGIGIMAGAVYSASKTTLSDGDVDFGNGTLPTLNSPLHFTGEGQSRMTGGNFTGERTKLGLVRKEGGGELLLSAGVSITGRLEVAGGKVRFPTKAEYPVVGKPGLMGSVTNVVCWTFDSPDKGNIPCVYDTVYPRGTDLTSRWNQTIRGPRTTMVRGYVWNRSSENVTWTFKANHVDRTWLWIDETNLFSNQQPTAAGNIVQYTLTPGPHKFALITTSNTGSGGSAYVKWTSANGSLYDSLPVDFTGVAPESWELGKASQFIDSGDGSLFTLDDVDTKDLNDPFWLTTIDTLACASGAEFDVGGYSYEVPALEGFPKVTNVGSFTVGSKWLLDADGIAAGQAATVAGAIIFKENTVLGLKTPWARATVEVLRKLDQGIDIVVAEAMSDQLPTLSAELLEAGAVLTKEVGDTSTKLRLRVPSDRYMKAKGNGVEVAYKVAAEKPYKQARIDVYRDGVLIDQKYIGDAYRSNAGTWKYVGDGYYFSVATVTYENGEEFKTTFGSEFVSGENMVFVSPVEKAGEYTSIIGAIAALDGPGRVYVRPGTYAENNKTNGVEVADAIQVIGMTDDPNEVVVTRKAGVNMRIFTVNHAEAALRFMTIKDGSEPWNDYTMGNGGNVFVGTNGGTIENCIIANGSTYYAWSAGGGNVALFNGRMSNCVLLGGQNNTQGADKWVNGGGSLLCLQKTATASVVVENCIIAGVDNPSRSGGAPVNLYGNAKLVNCTVVSNNAYFAGGVRMFKYQSVTPRVVNCAFFDNKVNGNVTNEQNAVYAMIPNFRNTENTVTPEEARALLVNCASEIEINATCVNTDEPGFVDAEHGDYSLLPDSPLVNAGADTVGYGAVSQYDLIGSPRKVKGIDIGCYEYRVPKFEPKGFYMIFRFR